MPELLRIRRLEPFAERDVQGLADVLLERVGEIPRYALWPDGSPCATQVFFKALGD